MYLTEINSPPPASRSREADIRTNIGGVIPPHEKPIGNAPKLYCWPSSSELYISLPAGRLQSRSRAPPRVLSRSSLMSLKLSQKSAMASKFPSAETEMAPRRHVFRVVKV